ncbi:hypothetical protein B0H19DRAFT_1197632 [Mycena capillaripes]|nr:hypothetical protein B0H19DRAFT_1197632 [Mycena capillaripes]
MTVNLGAVVSCPSGNPVEDSVEISLLPNVEVSTWRWYNHRDRAAGNTMGNGWIRFSSGDTFDRTFIMEGSTNIVPWLSWLSQANHIFSRLQITSNFENYVLMAGIELKVVVSAVNNEPPAGFFFICPKENLQTGSSTFCWPDCPAYWSLDPFGVGRLSTEEAARLGFPLVRLSTEVTGYSCDASVYAELRQFHQAKGFDPDSQDVARHLGQELYQLSNEVDPLFAHVDEEDSVAQDDDLDEFSMDLSW